MSHLEVRPGPLDAGGDAGRTGDLKRLKVVVIGAHPDDPESGCGGTMALFADAGHEVVSMYLTRGEAGIPGLSREEAAAVRTREAETACAILSARPVFLGQIDGATVVDAEQYDAVWHVLSAERPDILIAHWPIDTHRDHRAAGILAYDAWGRLDGSCALYYFEVESGEQTQEFRPTHYVDIAAVEPTKAQACRVHASQDPLDGFYALHQAMHHVRGKEAGVELAEAFVRHAEGERGGGESVHV